MLTKIQGRSVLLLERFDRETSSLVPGTALDAGAEAIWLASHGWHVTAADIAPEALARAAERATNSAVSARVRHATIPFQLERLLTGLLVREAEQQLERVAVRGDRLWTRVALGHQPVSVLTMTAAS